MSMSGADNNGEQFHPSTNVAVVIPVRNPSADLIPWLKQLLGMGIPQVIIIDDGSIEGIDTLDQIKEFKQCLLLRNEETRGSGRSIKKAFSYLMSQADERDGVITISGYALYAPEDVYKMAWEITNHPNTILLGKRNFDQLQLTTKRRVGHFFANLTFKLLFTGHLHDTQSPLKAYQTSMLPWLIGIKGEYFDYDLNVLIAAKKQLKPIAELDINAAAELIKNTESSPIRYAWTMFLGFSRYLYSSLSSTGVDLLIFYIMQYHIMANFTPSSLRILISVVTARVSASLINFTLNRTIVFSHHGNLGRSAARFYVTWFIQMMCSYGIVYLASLVAPSVLVLLKLVGDFFLAIANYEVQLHWVFKKTPPKPTVSLENNR